MPNNVRIHTSTDGNARKELKGLQDGWRTFQKAGAEGLAIGVGVTAATKAFGVLDAAMSTAIDGVFSSVKAASDLNETMSKSEVIFERNSDKVDKWASTADKAFGQSKRAALDAASGFAGLFQTVGVGLDQSTEMSQKLTELGSDLASFFNTGVDEALGALKSGLNGEAEPLRRFNVFLSETAVSAKLAEMGVKKTGGQFTEAQKATARYALILEQTTKAQGDFARTADGQANASRATAAEMENLSAEVGQELLPILRDLTKWTRDDGVPALRTLFETLKVLGGTFGDATPEVKNFREEAERTGWFWKTFGQQVPGSIDNVAEAAKNMQDGFVSSSREMRRSMDLVGDKARTTRVPITRLADKVKDLAGDFKDLDRWASEAGDTLAEASYGPEELRLKFEGARIELRDNEDALEAVRKKIKKLEDDGKPVPRALKKEFNEAKQAVNESKQEVIRLGTKLEVTGGISMADLRQQFATLGIKINATSGKAADLWWYLRHIADVDLGTVYDNLESSRKGGKASGGYEPAGSTFPVGEQGKPELVTALPGGGVMVSPLDGRGAWGMGNPAAPMTSASGGDWGMGGTTIIVNLQAPAAATPGSMAAFAETVGPSIAAYLQKRQLIAPARR